MRKLWNWAGRLFAKIDSLRCRTLITFFVSIALAITHPFLGVHFGPDYMKNVPIGVAIYLAMALLAVILPYIVKAKLPGGIEIELGIAMALNTSNNQLKTLEAKLTRITGTADANGHGADTSEPTPRPKLGKITDTGDQQRGRFGGKSIANGLTLSARFEEIGSRNVVRVLVNVKVTDGNPLADEVRFYLHETFKPDEVAVVPVNGIASLDLLTRGGFTVGAWIAGRSDTLLELDLSKVRGAPQIIRDL